MASNRTLSDVLGVELARLQAGIRPTGLPSGIGLERRVPGGILGDKITAIFAEPGNFKTTLKNNILLAMASAGFRVLDASLEDLPELTAHRYMARHSGVGYGEIAGGTAAQVDIDRIGLTLDHTAAKNIFVPPDDMAPTVGAITELALATNADCVAVDYVQLLGSDTGLNAEKQILDDAVKRFQRFARVTKTAVLLISQQKQQSDEYRANPRPNLNDMLGSSAMRIGAKLVIGLFRPWNKCKAPTQAKGPYAMYQRYLTEDPDRISIYPEILEAWVLKNVLGNIGAMHLRVHPETGYIENFDDEMRPYLR